MKNWHRVEPVRVAVYVQPATANAIIPTADVAVGTAGRQLYVDHTRASVLHVTVVGDRSRSEHGAARLTLCPAPLRIQYTISVLHQSSYSTMDIVEGGNNYDTTKHTITRAQILVYR